jgi:hypothetical protein
MFVVHSYAVAVFLAFITMLCWGSWANTQKLATKKWPFQLFYWDYAIGVLLLSLLMAFTVGSIGTEGRSFLADLSQAEFSALGSAFLGGVVFNIANLLLVAAIAIAGMAVAFPIGIGLALALGVIVNYIATPLGNPVLLFIGVAFVVVAIVLDAMAYKKAARPDRIANQGDPGFAFRRTADGLFLPFRGRLHGKRFCESRSGKADTIYRFGSFCRRTCWSQISSGIPFSCISPLRGKESPTGIT